MDRQSRELLARRLILHVESAYQEGESEQETSSLPSYEAINTVAATKNNHGHISDRLTLVR